MIGLLYNSKNNGKSIKSYNFEKIRCRPSEEIWVDPGFTIKTNGDVRVGAFLATSQRKIGAQQHISFSYVASE